MRSLSSTASLTLRHVSRRCDSRLLVVTRQSSTTTAPWSTPAVRHAARGDVLELLSTRGFIKDFAGDRNALQKVLQQRPVGFYAGIDPTAPSLHLGHLLPLMVLFWLHVHGHNSISLVGGATAQIGDPSGRLTSRAKTARSTHIANTTALRSQVGSLWEKAEAYSARHGFQAQQYGKRKLLDNRDWLLQLSIVDFLSSLGSSMRIGAMLGRDTVKNKLEKGDGVSFAEFSYPLLQGWDWWHMFHNHGVQVQIGGSDQYGNIVAGLDAVKAVAHSLDGGTTTNGWSTPSGNIRDDHTPMGITTPLLTTASGDKFGKSAGNAIWLNPEMTSPFDLYGFLLRTADEDVKSYLNLFTFVSSQEIDNTINQHMQDPGLRVAQHLLAAEVLELVHGQQEAEKTARSHRLLRNKHATIHGFNAPSTCGEVPTLDDAERTLLPRSLVASASFARILYHAGLVSTRSEGARLIRGGGAYVAVSSHELGSTDTVLDFTSIKDLSTAATISLTNQALIVVRLGKWKVRVIEAVDDHEFDKAGLDVPGWQEWKVEHNR